MKSILFILLFLPFFVLAQNEDTFFLIQDLSVADSISFSGKVEKYKNVFKLKGHQEVVKFTIYKSDDVFEFDVDKAHIGQFNVISIDNKSTDKTRLLIRRGHVFVTMDYEQYNFAHFDIEITAFSLLADNDKIYTNSPYFNELLVSNLDFFLR